MFDIYLSPSRAFGRLKEKPTWLIPLIIVLVFNMLIAFVSARYVDWDKQRQLAVDRMRDKNMSEEQIQKATDGMQKFYGSPVMRYGAPPVSALFVSLIGFLFLTVVYNVSLPLLGGASDFKRAWAIVCNASLVAVPSAIVRGALVLMKKSAEVSTSLFMFAPNLKNPFLSVVLARIDIFAIWQLILCAIGLNVIFGLKGSKSYLLVFAVWAVVTLIFALLGMRAGGR
jgi:hypothetical protein